MVSLRFPLFLGLSHIGQVYSKCWLKKVGRCAVYDFDKKNLNNFLSNNFTNEEPSLKKIKNLKKFKIIENNNNIKFFQIIFLTIDTPISSHDGKPDTNLIEKYYKNLSKINFLNSVKVILTSQVPVGFTNYLKLKYHNQNIELIYMVDTLKMGNAIERFLKPDQLIFGCNNKNKNFIKIFFKKFKCKKYIFTHEEAELIKIAINVYLLFNVSFANIFDEVSRSYNLNFSKLLNTLKNDPRIGNQAYIHPSIAISGGHLERDYFYLKKAKNKSVNKILDNLIIFNKKRKKNLLNKVLELNNKKKIIKIIIVGISYKQNSFSLVNSIFYELTKNKKIKVFYYDDFFQLKNDDKFTQIKKLENLDYYDCLIYNYSKISTFNNIKKKLNLNKNVKVINISSNFKTKINKKSYDYFINEQKALI